MPPKRGISEITPLFAPLYIYEADPFECPKCKGPMRVIALIEDPGVILPR